MMSSIRGVAMGIALLLGTFNLALAADTTSPGSGSGSTTYNGALYAVNWTDFVTSTYSTDFNGNKTISSQVQGGCVNNAASLSQTVSGNVTYYWPGGSRGPIYSTIVNPITTICQSGDAAWGNGPTYNDPVVVFLIYDPPRSDYVYIFSQWYCGSCYPFYLQRSAYWYWN
jgi:hypothetical protein